MVTLKNKGGVVDEKHTGYNCTSIPKRPLSVLEGMKILAYTDLQATDGHEKCFNDPAQSLQISRVNSLYGVLLQIYQDYQCQALWDLGDTTDDRSAIPVPAIQAVCSSLAQFPQSKWHMKLIGNHEQFLRNTTIHVGELFAPYFTVVAGNAAYVLPDGTRLLCCSYPADLNVTVKWLEKQKQIAAGKPTILLGHFSVTGCMTGDGRLLAGVPKEALSWVNLGLLGHIHKPQSVTKRVHYVGSPFQQNWGETGEDKRVAIVDTSTQSVEWIPITGFPEYKTVNLQDFNELCSAETEDRFKVILKSQAEAATFYAHPLARRAEPVYEFLDETEVSDVSSPAETAHRWSFESVIKRYVERFTPDAKGIPASVDEMVDYGRFIATAS